MTTKKAAKKSVTKKRVKQTPKAPVIKELEGIYEIPKPEFDAFLKAVNTVQQALELTGKADMALALQARWDAVHKKLVMR